jgi:coenzyme F420-0:L-glutamate ligase/coenzyme F420-1:gamma-L-glutamate ligase
VVVIAQKIVSKAEGRLVRLSETVPSARAREIAEITQKDPRFVEAVLSDTGRVLRTAPGLLIVEHRLGFVCANAGVDRSNVAGDAGETIALLPLDPDGSASRIRDGIRAITGQTVAVIINDSHGRAFREGAVGVAIGVAGLHPLTDERGQSDLFGYQMRVTTIGTADELASAASLVMGQTDEATPVVIIRGASYRRGPGDIQELLRERAKDLFR